MSVTDVFDTLKGVTIAVIDELGGRGKASDHHYDSLYRAIESRQGKPTFLISNLNLDELREVYDDRIVDRIMCGTRIGMNGIPNMRNPK